MNQRKTMMDAEITDIQLLLFAPSPCYCIIKYGVLLNTQEMHFQQANRGAHKTHKIESHMQESATGLEKNNKN